jgi:hypothetical protein
MGGVESSVYDARCDRIGGKFDSVLVASRQDAVRRSVDVDSTIGRFEG